MSADRGQTLPPRPPVIPTSKVRPTAPPPREGGPVYAQAHADGYDAGHADGYNEGRREADITGHLLRPHAQHLLAILAAERCEECAEMRRALEDLLP